MSLRLKMRTLPLMREMCSLGAGLKPTDTEAKIVASEGGWLFQILAEPCSQFVPFLGAATRDVWPLESLRRCLKDSLRNATLLVFAADDQADVFAFFYRIMTLREGAFVLCLDEGEASCRVRRLA
jgi:hypothetical protein